MLDIIDIKSAVKDKQIYFFVKDDKIYCRWFHDNGEIVCVGEVQKEENNTVP
jgi:hypothetical protein